MRVRELFLFNMRVLTFRATREEFASFTHAHLIFGLMSTWLVGIGRWWDDPGARLVQHLGLGSVAYIFVLAAIIWLLVMPLRPRQWSYRHVLTFISLTSLPAMLYALPVERFFSIDTAVVINLWFLVVVALWRVALFFYYLRRHADLSWFTTLVVGLLPLSAIVVALFALNLHRVVFEIMGGLREVQRSAHDFEYGVLFFLSMLSIFTIVPLLLGYLGVVIYSRKHKSEASSYAEPKRVA